MVPLYKYLVTFVVQLYDRSRKALQHRKNFGICIEHNENIQECVQRNIRTAYTQAVTGKVALILQKSLCIFFL